MSLLLYTSRCINPNVIGQMADFGGKLAVIFFKIRSMALRQEKWNNNQGLL